MADAWIGRKSCGCVVAARLCEYRPRGSSAWMADLAVERVPVRRAKVTVCRCFARREAPR